MGIWGLLVDNDQRVTKTAVVWRAMANSNGLSLWSIIGVTFLVLLLATSVVEVARW